jgi:DNA-binding response OmpR family regulator
MNEVFKILVVDDNQDNLKVVSSLLKERGYKIALALDGYSALKVLENENIDLILLDIMMPGMDGFEVCRRLKENEKLKEIPIVFLTAVADTEDIVEGFRLGGVDYVTKPFRMEELLARVNTHIQLKITHDMLKAYAEEYKESRDFFMARLLEFGKLFGPK